MKLIAKRLRNLYELYGNQLQMLLSAEEQVVRLWLDMQQWANDEELKSLLQRQHDATEQRVPRIRNLAGLNTIDPESVRCKVLPGLAAETEDLVADAADPMVCDVALITAAQRVKHYEIAVLGAVRDFASVVGRQDEAAALSEMLNAEKSNDRFLTELAGRLNAAAMEPLRS